MVHYDCFGALGSSLHRGRGSCAGVLGHITGGFHASFEAGKSIERKHVWYQLFFPSAREQRGQEIPLRWRAAFPLDP